MTKKILGILLMLGLVVPGISGAQSVADLQAQIAALLAQINSLQVQLLAAQGGSSAWCHTFNANMRILDSGSEVKALRQALTKEGLFSDNDNSSEYTESLAIAVSQFQERYSSEVLRPFNLSRGTGYAGPSTRAMLNRLYGCGNVNPSPTPTLPTPIPNLSILISSPNGGSFPAGSKLGVTWDRNGDIPSGSYYFVYLKNSPAQVLGGVNSPPYTPLIFRSASLGYPTFNVDLPSDLNTKGSGSISPGTYYLEIDVANANGVPIASATSRSFTITTSGQSVEAPIVYTVDPSLAKPGSSVNVLGANFPNDAIVALFHQDYGFYGNIKPVSRTATHLQFVVPQNLSLNDKSVNLFKLVVGSLSGSAKDSNAVDFRVEHAGSGTIPSLAPTITTVSPSTIHPGGSVIVYGSNFSDKASIYLKGTENNGGYGLVANSRTSSLISFQVPTTAKGKYLVHVTNVPGNTSSYINNGLPLTVTSSDTEPPVVVPVSITSPSAGASWKLGETRVISWSNLPALTDHTMTNLNLVDASGMVWGLTYGKDWNSANKTSYTFVVSDVYDGEGHQWIPIKDGKYKVKMGYYVNSVYMTAESGWFTISSGNNTPSKNEVVLTGVEKLTNNYGYTYPKANFKASVMSYPTEPETSGPPAGYRGFYELYATYREPGALSPLYNIIVGRFYKSDTYPKSGTFSLTDRLDTGKDYVADFYLQEYSWGSLPYNKKFLNSVEFSTK